MFQWGGMRYWLRIVSINVKVNLKVIKIINQTICSSDSTYREYDRRSLYKLDSSMFESFIKQFVMYIIN